MRSILTSCVAFAFIGACSSTVLLQNEDGATSGQGGGIASGATSVVANGGAQAVQVSGSGGAGLFASVGSGAASGQGAAGASGAAPGTGGPGGVGATTPSPGGIGATSGELGGGKGGVPSNVGGGDGKGGLGGVPGQSGSGAVGSSSGGGSSGGLAGHSGGGQSSTTGRGGTSGSVGSGSAGSGSAGSGSAGSGAAGSGAAGSGGTPVGPVLKSLGGLCGGNADCSSKFCVDGVCCESACDGVCQSCSAAGRCNVMPADEPACPTVTCPSDTLCADYAPAITSNRCRALGQCKTQQDCSFVPATGTSCGSGKLCNGLGQCADSIVGCGAANCDVATSECCVEVASARYSCNVPGTACGTTNDWAYAGYATKISCDQDADCATGSVCCIFNGNGYIEGLKCMAAADCDVTKTYQYSGTASHSLCESPAGVNKVCPSGKTCQSIPDYLPPVYKFCR